MIIEFTGYPGSGKTYTRDLLYDRLEAKGVKVWKPRNRIKDLRITSLLSFEWENWKFILETLKLIHPQKDLLLWKFWLVQILNYCSIPANSITLLDEGWTQFGVSIIWNKDLDMTEYIKLKPKSLILYLDTPLEMCMERMRERGWYPRRWTNPYRP